MYKILAEYDEEWEEKARQKKFNELKQQNASLKSENEKLRSELDKERSESRNKINELNEIIKNLKG